MQRKSLIFTSAFAIGLSGAMMPGPLLAACVGYTLDSGFWAGGPLLILGHAILEATLILLILLGLGPLLARPRVGAAIGLIGGGVLLWMGHGMLAWAASGRATLATAAHGPAPLAANPVLAGIVVSLANPYWSLWWATIGLKYLALSRHAGRAGLAAFFCGHQLSDLGWYCFVAGALALGRRAIPDTLYRWLIGICGAAMVAFGLYFLHAGIRGLLRRPLRP